MLLAGVSVLIPAQPLLAQPCSSAPCVLTSQYDNNRDGYNPNEALITPSNLFDNGMTLLAPLIVDTPPTSALPPTGSGQPWHGLLDV